MTTLANCGVDGCAPLPGPLRAVLGVVLAGMAGGFAVAWLRDRWRARRARQRVERMRDPRLWR